MGTLLQVEELRTSFFLDEGELCAVDGVSFEIEEGETVALVGESGCGKTIVALSILQLVSLPGRILGGRVLLDGRDILSLDHEALRAVRGRAIGLVFQEPGAALNPVYAVGAQIAEVLREHRGMLRAEAEREAVRLLGEVGIAEPEKRARAYPFELSGGMKQRAVIALATCARPRLLLADEPTTALDVTVQAEILELLSDLQRKHGMAILIISHDLAVVAQLARRVMVMYTGRLVETATTAELFRAPAHPYTRGLLASVARVGEPDVPLHGIPGAVPDLLALPTGCTFHPRCPLADETCAQQTPALVEIGRGRRCACWHAAAEDVVRAPSGGEPA